MARARTPLSTVYGTGIRAGQPCIRLTGARSGRLLAVDVRTPVPLAPAMLAPAVLASTLLAWHPDAAMAQSSNTPAPANQQSQRLGGDQQGTQNTQQRGIAPGQTPLRLQRIAPNSPGLQTSDPDPSNRGTGTARQRPSLRPVQPTSDPLPQSLPPPFASEPTAPSRGTRRPGAPASSPFPDLPDTEIGAPETRPRIARDQGRQPFSLGNDNDASRLRQVDPLLALPTSTVAPAPGRGQAAAGAG
ncbi:MAG: hypothetical protein AAFO79_06990, partial [Pseudomonadota bacterium]